MRISRPSIWVSATVLVLCAVLAVIALIVSNRDVAASHPRRYIDYLPDSRATSTQVDQCSLPLAQRTGPWTCYP